MFDIGFLELVIIAIISLLVLGPERLPVAARQVGRWIGKARRMASQFSREIDRQIEIEELREELKKQSEHLDLEAEANQIHNSVQEALSEAEKPEVEKPEAENINTPHPKRGSEFQQTKNEAPSQVSKNSP